MMRIFLMVFITVWGLVNVATAGPMSSYPAKQAPVAGDKVLIVDSQDSNKTKTATIGSFPGNSPPWLPGSGPTAANQIIQATGDGTSAWTDIIDGLINDSGDGTDDVWSASKIITELAAKTDDQSSTEVATVTTSFNGILSSSDNTVQKALDTIDDIDLSGSSTVILQQSFVSSETLIADTGQKTKIPTGIDWGTADIGCDESDSFVVSVKSSPTVNGTYTEIGTVSLQSESSASDVDISSWPNSTSGHWIRIDLTGTPESAKNCIIAVSGDEL